MNTEVTPNMTHEQIIDLRRKVLAGEEVTNDELRQALATLALTRASASAGATAKAAKVGGVKVSIGNLGDAFAKFKAKSVGGSASSTSEG